MQSRGRVFCLEDEPGVYRVWMPNGKTPGLAISRAFGDYCVKDFGLICAKRDTKKTDHKGPIYHLGNRWVWDVISNQEAMKIVSSTPDKEKAAQRFVKCAVHEWKRKRGGIVIDDIQLFASSFTLPPLINSQLLKLSNRVIKPLIVASL